MLQERPGRRWCRLHERNYLLHPATPNADIADTLDYIGSHIHVANNNGCWKYRGRQPNGSVTDSSDATTRTKVLFDSTNWLVHRTLYVWFYNGHGGSLELHHLCGIGACVNPTHLRPVTAKVNKRAEKKAFWWVRALTKWRCSVSPTPPADPGQAAELSKFTANHGLTHRYTAPTGAHIIKLGRFHRAQPKTSALAP